MVSVLAHRTLHVVVLSQTTGKKISVLAVQGHLIGLSTNDVSGRVFCHVYVYAVGLSSVVW